MQRLAARLTGGALVFGSALIVGLSAPAMVSADTTNDVFDRIDALERQANDLSQSLDALGFSGSNPTPQRDVGGDVLIAQSRDVATLNLKLGEMEEQMRSLTGQVEGVQFQVTQIYQQLERMQEDNDFRFQQLESGLGKTDAVIQSGGAMPVGESPQSGNDPVAGPTDPVTGMNDPIGEPLDTELAGSELGTPMDEGLMVDPLDPSDDLTLGSDEEFEPLFDGPLTLDLGGDSGIDFGQSTISGVGQALSLDFDPGQLINDGDAEAQFQAGYDAVIQGDYDFAIAQFSQFIALFDTHPLAPDASNWLGESLLQKELYTDAAEVFFVGYQKYQNSLRAPELLLKLGVALAASDERDTACRTFIEVQKRYPEMSGAFAQRVSDEMAQAQC